MYVEEISTDFGDLLAPNVGIIRRESEGVGLILKGAWVNGVMYGDTTTSVDDHEKETVSSTFLLCQNYPNPFNSNTTINYLLKEAIPTMTQLSIYNLSGKEIKKLIHEKQDAGEYSVKWDGKDNFGKEVGNGVYIYQLKSDKFKYSRKLTIIK
jgi:flagellar hook assembly protein FlgD